MNQENRKPNHLIQEKSPYLLQHAYNPVNWYPWSEEAFDKAKTETNGCGGSLALEGVGKY